MEIEILEEIANNAAAEYGFSVVQTTFAREKPGWVLRILIEKPDSDPNVGSGVDLEACSAVSRRVGDVIESEELLDKAFTLEVSSAGVERPLVQPADYRRFVGRDARFKLRSEIENRKRLQGEIIDCDDERVRVSFGKNRKVLEIPYSLIAKANLVFTSRW